MPVFFSSRCINFLFFGLECCSLPEVAIISFLPLQLILLLCEAARVQFSDPYKNVGTIKVLYKFKIVYFLTFLKVFLLIVTINFKHFYILHHWKMGKIYCNLNK